jgi:hypothetical protein
MALTKIKTSGIADNAITNAKMADDAIDSADFADASIDNVHVATGLDAVKLADGTVTNTELQYINTLSSNAQTQISAKLPLSGGAMTGAITTNSTFDGVDIATRDGVLTSTTTTANAALPKAGGTMTGAVTGMTGLTGGTGDFNWDSNTLVVDSSESRVGIGTATPGSKLEIAGGADAIARVLGTTTAARLDLQTDSYHKFIQILESDGRFRLYNQTTNREQLTVSSDGNIGIGTSAPASTLPSGFNAGTGGVLEIKSSSTSTDLALLLRRSDAITGLDIWHDSSGAEPSSYFDNRYEESNFYFRSETRGTARTLMTIDGSDGNATFSGQVTAPSLILTPSSAPTATEGAMYYDSTSDKVVVWNGTAWEQVSNLIGFEAKGSGGHIINYSIGSTNYVVHTFTSSGVFTPTSSFDVDYLVVAGGGGSSDMSGGGGAGGYQSGTSSVSASGYTITVGAGGSGTVTDSNTNGGNGSNSSFGNLTASVGGGGAGYEGAAGSSGGSGGGGSYSTSGGSDGGAGTTGQGYDGGAGRDSTGTEPHNYPGGGGGGASEAGARAVAYNSAAGNGGDGIQNNIDGLNCWYAGGGGGHGYNGGAGNGGKGGGGGGNRTFQTGGGASGLGDTNGRNDGGDGADTGTYAFATGHGGLNTGGGAGGGTNHSPGNDPHFSGANGGSGIVIIRYTI